MKKQRDGSFVVVVVACLRVGLAVSVMSLGSCRPREASIATQAPGADLADMAIGQTPTSVLAPARKAGSADSQAPLDPMAACLAFLEKQDRSFFGEGSAAPIPPKAGRCFVLGKEYFALVYWKHEVSLCRGTSETLTAGARGFEDQLMLVRSSQQADIWSREDDADSTGHRQLSALQFGSWGFEYTAPCGKDSPRQNVDLMGVYDLDHDGVPELLIHKSSEVHDCNNHRDGDSERQILTWHTDGTAEIYEHAPPAVYFGPNPDHLTDGDINKDGMPELFSRGPYERVDRGVCSNNGDLPPAIPPVFAHHLLPDGTFSMNDDVARAAIRAWCKAPIVWTEVEKQALRGELGSKNLDPARLAVCARVYGQDAKTTTAAMDKICQAYWKHQAQRHKEQGTELPTDPKDCEVDYYDLEQGGCQRWLHELSEISPPLTLR